MRQKLPPSFPKLYKPFQSAPDVAGTPKIPEALWPEVRERSRTGDSSRVIAAWLGDSHGIEVSHAAVATLLAGQRAEEGHQRRELAQLIQAHEVRTLTLGLEALEREGGHLVALCERLRGEVTDFLDQPLPSDPQPGEITLVPASETKASELPLEARLFLRARTLGALTANYLRSVGMLRQFTELKLKRGPVKNDRRAAEIASAAQAVARRLDAEPPPGGEGGLPAADSPDGDRAGGASVPVELLGPATAIGPSRALVDLVDLRRPGLRKNALRRRVGARPGRERGLQASRSGWTHRSRCPRHHDRG